MPRSRDEAPAEQPAESAPQAPAQGGSGTLAGGKPLRPPPLAPLDTGDAADDQPSG